MKSEGKIKTGYDYKNQCWLHNHIIQACGHPENMKPDCCFSGKYSGRDIRGIGEWTETDWTETEWPTTDE